MREGDQILTADEKEEIGFLMLADGLQSLWHLREAHSAKK